MTTTFRKNARSFTAALGMVGLSLIPVLIPSHAAAESTTYRYDSQLEQNRGCDPRSRGCNSAGGEGWTLREKGTTTYSDGFKRVERTTTHMQGNWEWEDKMIREGYFATGIHSYQKDNHGKHRDRKNGEFYFDRQYLELSNGFVVTCEDPAFRPAQTQEGGFVCVPLYHGQQRNQLAPGQRW